MSPSCVYSSLPRHARAMPRASRRVGRRAACTSLTPSSSEWTWMAARQAVRKTYLRGAAVRVRERANLAARLRPYSQRMRSEREPIANPDALDDAPPARSHRFGVNGTSIYAEIRGDGPPILLIPGGAEDAEGWRAVAERLVGHTVVTYDRRGTLRSGRDDWPGRGSAQHADDAAALLREIGLGPAVAFGASSAGIVATQLALQHPTVLRRVLVYEPGYLRAVPGGAELQDLASAAAVDHLDRLPGDWVGAYRALVRAAAPSTTPGGPGFLSPPAGGDWYARREEVNAE